MKGGHTKVALKWTPNYRRTRFADNYLGYFHKRNNK